jgi:RES domain-containing protein
VIQRTTSPERVTERVFRHCQEDHANLRATLEASSGAPGRFHVLREFGAVYVATDRETTLAELDHRARRAGLSREDLLPRLLLTLELAARRILDLTDEAVRKAWGLTLDDLAGDEYARCQEVARAARDDGYEAIRFPSARGAGQNYAVFLDRLAPGSHLREVDREEI